MTVKNHVGFLRARDVAAVATAASESRSAPDTRRVGGPQLDTDPLG